jgi:hypothetical protein
LAIVAVPESEIAQSPAIPDPVANAVALQFSVAPESVPCAVPDTCRVLKHVAVKVPAMDDADCCVTFQRKFVHDESSEPALLVVELHWPPRRFTVGVGFVFVLVNVSKHPALNTENTRAIAHNFLVMTLVLPQEILSAVPCRRGLSL